jgi:ERCC4-related helicase
MIAFTDGVATFNTSINCAASMKSPAHIKQKINAIRENKTLEYIFRKGHTLYLNGQIIPLLESDKYDEFMIPDQYEDFKVKQFFDESLSGNCSCGSQEICPHRVVALLHVHEFLSREEKILPKPGVLYTREGMIKRVIAERFGKAKQAKYLLQLSDNLYGEHILQNEKGQHYAITFHDFQAKTGYCSCPDFRTNKLGTCKHLIWAFKKVSAQSDLLKGKSKEFPFVEIYLNPRNDYQISWFYPGRVPEPELAALLFRYFDSTLTLIAEKESEFHLFLQKAEAFRQVVIRPEVFEKLEQSSRKIQLLALRNRFTPNYNQFKRELFSYQKQGAEFIAFREKVLLADEIGLGKTAQAIAAAIFKRELLGFKKCLILSPASLLAQWQQEIARTCQDTAIILNNSPILRKEEWEKADSFFYLVNYEKVLRDPGFYLDLKIDFLILDEVQRLRNYESKTVRTLQQLKALHTLALSGIPVEHKLTDLYSIMSLLDPGVLAPLWEFSYQHYYFDPEDEHKITGYHHLNELSKRLSDIVLRRTRKEVQQDLPEKSFYQIAVQLDADQILLQEELLRQLDQILNKRFLSSYDWQSIFRLVNKLRMIADSAFLVNQGNAAIPKLQVLKDLLINKLNIREGKQKLVIFSEWKPILLRIAKLLREESIPFVELHGDVPVNQRAALLQDFNQNPACKVFLSSETGGAGLNLQVADLILNFDLPWSESQLDQRIGRIDRIGQGSSSVQIINLVSTPSIESEMLKTFHSREFGLKDLFLLNTESGSELEVKPMLDLLKEMTQLLLKAEHRSDSSLNLFIPSNDWENYQVQILSEEAPDSSESKTDLTAAIFDKQARDPEKFGLLIEQIELYQKFYELTTGEKLFEDHPILEEKNDEWLIHLRKSK